MVIHLTPKQGEIFYCYFDKPIGARPVLILSRSELNAIRQNVVVALITRTIRNIPTEIRLNKTEGLKVECVVSLGDIHTVPKSYLRSSKGSISKEKLQQMLRGLQLIFKIV